MELLLIKIKNKKNNKSELSRIKASLRLKLLFYLEKLYKHIRNMSINDPSNKNQFLNLNNKDFLAYFFKNIYDDLYKDENKYYEYFNNEELIEFKDEY